MNQRHDCNALIPNYLRDLRWCRSAVGSSHRLTLGVHTKIVMGMWDNAANRQFATDESGRLIFIPRGRRRAGYIVDAAEEPKIKSLVKVYFVAAALINFTGSIASIGVAQSFERPVPLAHEIRFVLVVYAISFALFYVVPALLLWNVYRRVIGNLCASLVTVDPSSLRLTCLPSSSSRTMLIVSGVAFVLVVFLALGILLVVARKLLS